MAEHFETWLELASAGQFDGQGDHPTPAPYVEKAFRKYLDEAFASAESAGSVNAPSITFHPAQIDEAAITKMQAQVQANVRKRLLRYCARPPFAMDRLKQRGADLVYRSSKGHAEPMQSDKYSGELVLCLSRPLNPNRAHHRSIFGRH